MAWKVEKRHARTNDGRKALFVRYDDLNWPAPFVFEIDGPRICYSIGGYAMNRTDGHEPIDLAGPWDDRDLISVPRESLLVVVRPIDLGPRARTADFNKSFDDLRIAFSEREIATGEGQPND